MKTSTQNQFVFSTGVIAYPILFVLAIWIVFWFEIRFGYDFNNWGIFPRDILGLRGILFGPFIHANIEHLFHNTIPLFVLSLSLFYFYNKISWQVIIYGLIFTGLLTWIVGRPANHIGASGIIYMLTGFLFFKGIFSKHYRLIALSLIVVFLYGGLVWYIVPIDPKISWEGHLSGLITGFILSLFYKDRIVKAPKYDWEQEEYNEENDPFMRHFDEQGNFIEFPTEENLDETDPEDENPSSSYIYHFKKNNSTD